MTAKKELKALIACLACLIIILSATGCSNNKNNSGVKRIQDKKVLVLGTSADAPPFEYQIMQKGKKKIVGFDIMLGQKIADELGVKLKIENIAFPALITELKQKKADIVLASMVKTPSRAKVVTFSKPYYKGSNYLLVRKADANKYQKTSDLTGKSIGAQQSSAKEQVAKTQLPKANLVTESSLGTLTTELKLGKVAGVILGKEDAEVYSLKYPNTYAVSKLKLKTTSDISAVSVATNKEDKDLLKRVNKVITHLQKNGQLDKMHEKAQKQQLQFNK